MEMTYRSPTLRICPWIWLIFAPCVYLPIEKRPRVTMILGLIAAIWRSRYASQAESSSGNGSRFSGGRHFTTLAWGSGGPPGPVRPIRRKSRGSCRRRLEPPPLQAKTLSGHVVKNDKVGWYLRTNHSVGIDTEGNYYSLTVPGGWMERLRGVKLEPTLAPLVIGRGGRDGETGDLKEFLAWALEGRIPQD